MGTTRDDFHKYPRTPHLFGSTGTSDDKHLGARESEQFLADPSLIVEEKLDGTNVGIHFTTANRMVLQCRGHEITPGMHPQYDLFKQWVMVKRSNFERILTDRFILFGEWLYAKHSVYYRALPHYFFEFDILDKETGRFLDLTARLGRIEGSGLQTVPIVHRGALSLDELRALVATSAFEAEFKNPEDGRCDALVEGLYLRTEAEGCVTGRAKFVRPEFVEKVKQSTHWQQQPLVPNLLMKNKDIWS